MYCITILWAEKTRNALETDLHDQCATKTLDGN